METNRFMQLMKGTLDNRTQETENGAIGFQTTGKKLVDMNFAVSSLRNSTEEEIKEMFTKVYFEDKVTAIKWLFFAGDVRQGLGERRLFRICFGELLKINSKAVINLLKLIPEYTRWDNLTRIVSEETDKDVVETVFNIVKNQIAEDINNFEENKPISLLAKWMPSNNSSSYETKKLAEKYTRALELKPTTYRKMLSKLRRYLKVVEVSMSKGEWDKIEYSAVPSRANLIYKDAFMKHDEVRRTEYLDSLSKGETKINAGVLFPHDIIAKYLNVHGWNYSINEYDEAVEQLWKALPDYVKGQGNTICVVDGSGSMYDNKASGNIACAHVAQALGIYFAERSSGYYKDTYITFSENPQYVDFSNAKSLREKLIIASKYDECANTNIERVFMMILKTAVDNKLDQSELPANILILSDMEFDGHVVCSSSNTCSEPRVGFGYCRPVIAPDTTLFENIAYTYAQYGYKMPRLVFWNIYSRTGTIPVKENEMGVALVSGFSTTICDMVLSSETDPYKVLLNKINSERYKAVEEAINIDLL